MNIVHVDYEEILDDEEQTVLSLSTRIHFNRNISKKEDLFKYLFWWKPIRATIISVKNESGDVLLNRESCDSFFKDQ